MLLDRLPPMPMTVPGRVTGISHKKASAAIIEQFAYTYDNAGNRRTGTENSGDVTTWTYDNANQLTIERKRAW